MAVPREIVRFCFLILKLALIGIVIQRVITQANAIKQVRDFKPSYRAYDEIHEMKSDKLYYDECKCRNVVDHLSEKSINTSESELFDAAPYHNFLEQFVLPVRFRGTRENDTGIIVFLSEKSFHTVIYAVEIDLFHSPPTVQIYGPSLQLLYFHSPLPSEYCLMSLGQWRLFTVQYNWVLGNIQVFEGDKNGTLLVNWSEKFHKKSRDLKYFTFSKESPSGPNTQVAFDCEPVVHEFLIEERKLAKQTQIDMVPDCNGQGGLYGFICKVPSYEPTNPTATPSDSSSGYTLLYVTVAILSAIILLMCTCMKCMIDDRKRFF